MIVPLPQIVLVPAPELTDAELREAIETMTAGELASLIRTVYAAAGGLQ